MRFRRYFLGLVVLVISALPLLSQPAPLAGFKDEGSFLLYVNEERVGILKFQWQEDGTFSTCRPEPHRAGECSVQKAEPR